jgi:hypothetical protein
VLAVDGDSAANRTLRVYARCGASVSSVVVFGTNIGVEHQTLTFALPLASATARDDYILSGTLGGPELLLNGVPMEWKTRPDGGDGSDDGRGGTAVPQFGGDRADHPGAPLALAPTTSFFTVFSGIEVGRLCQQG